ncbi:hypothetical protein T439DRAFT_283116 [Meredithblackwellia eburnea MCA 4105]
MRLQNPPYTPPTLDIVFSHYAEPVELFQEFIDLLRSRSLVSRSETRIVVYSKGNDSIVDALREGLKDVDEIVQLENFGREGGTYLRHILQSYNASLPASDQAAQGKGLAEFTVFLQDRTPFSFHSTYLRLESEYAVASHTDAAWRWILEPRLDFFDAGRTGFLSLGPYVKSDCGFDMLGNGDFKRVKDIFVMFRETLCAPTFQLTSYAAQFVVSRRRIMANSYQKYKTLQDLLLSPEGHWTYTEGGGFYWAGPPSPTNPYLGHAIERSWPFIFNCGDPVMADRCTDSTYDKEVCQCFDQ